MKSNDGFVVRSIQRKQRPAAHYNNKIHADKTVSSLMFTMKRTAKKISLQLSFESSVGNSRGPRNKNLAHRGPLHWLSP